MLLTRSRHVCEIMIVDEKAEWTDPWGHTHYSNQIKIIRIKAKTEISSHQSVNRILLKTYARMYHTLALKKRVYLIDVKKGEYLSFSYSTRFDQRYKKQQLDKIFLVKKILQKYQNFGWLTMTVPHSPDPMTAYKFLQHNFNKFLTYLKKYAKKRYNVDIKIIRVNELHNDGYIHLHALVAGLKYIPRKILKKYSGYGFIKYKYLSSMNATGAFNYLLKYIMKNFNAKDKYDYLSVFWALGIRIFSTSKNVERELSLIRSTRINQTDELLKIKYMVVGIKKMVDLDHMKWEILKDSWLAFIYDNVDNDIVKAWCREEYPSLYDALYVNILYSQTKLENF
jgi:stress-induced morphogen